jgi:hypothetical protein
MVIALQLLLNAPIVRLDMVTRFFWRDQQVPIECAIVLLLDLRPRKNCGGGQTVILVNHALGDLQGSSHLFMRQSGIQLETQDFFKFTHAILGAGMLFPDEKSESLPVSVS